MDWISVDERLPEHAHLVLAWFEGVKHHSGMGWRRAGYRLTAYWHKDQNKWHPLHFQETLEKLDADYGDITHWMPLPDPPKET